MIDPKEIIKTLSVEELCSSAEAYYHAIGDPLPIMGKPFTSLLEAPEVLMSLGSVLSGMQMGKGMTVLDFGAGSCWLSRLFNQLGCMTISCDPSRTALEMGRRLFREYPVIGRPLAEPRFLHFDGHTIDLPDTSVDRIVCFDMFHHVPNQAEVLGEFSRVLKQGGMVGFSEPGRFHSQQPQSQSEMKNYRVLENDIDINEIFKLAQQAKFSDFSCKLTYGDALLSLADYNAIMDGEENPDIKSILFTDIHNIMKRKTVFFLHKGTAAHDSRSAIGLAHTMQTQETCYSVEAGEDLVLSFTITNVGESVWLHRNISDSGVVKLGAHLYNETGRLMNLDFFRKNFSHNIAPKETVTLTATVTLVETGKFTLVFDLVSEYVCWFENIGSSPVAIEVLVR